MYKNTVVKFDGVSKVFELHRDLREAIWPKIPIFQILNKSTDPNTKTKVALNAVSLSIEKGEKVGIIGRNGSGKTTLLRLLIGQTRPSTGTITLTGKVQALMQTGFGFNPELSGIDNIKNSLLYNGLKPEEHPHFVSEILDFVELGKFIEYPIKTYSLGMHARLEFAVATAIQPDVLVIDEVMGAGDGYFARKSANRMRNLVAKSTLVLVSHSLSQVAEFCDRTIWLDNGEIMADGDTEKVIKDYETFMAEYNAKRHIGASSPQPDQAPKTDDELSLFKDSYVADQNFNLAIRASLAGEVGPTVKFEKRQPDGLAYIICPVGERLSFDITVDFGAKYSPQDTDIVLWGYSASGAYLFKSKVSLSLLSPAKKQNFCISKPKSNIGIGEYIIFCGLFCNRRRKVIAVCEGHCKLRVPPTNSSDPPYVHLQGTWTDRNNHVQPARIDARI